MDDFQGKRVTVAGLGRFGGGVAVSRWLARQGAAVTVTDRDSAGAMGDSVRQLDGLGIEFHLGGHVEGDFTEADWVVASPAIPPGNPFLVAARSAGVGITTEIRLFTERCPAAIAAVTGTKGKSTTTAMLGAILSRSRRTWVGGNIGKSLLADLPAMSPSDAVVLELSSYMLEYLRDARWSPQVAVVTMIAPDHLEWHGSFDAYVAAKRVIVANQTAGDFVLANARDGGAVELAKRSKGRFIGYGDGERFDLILPGEHNQLNAQGAFAAASILGATREQASGALASFAGLPHRLQLVHEEGGVKWFNDSIATIPQAAIAALGAFGPGKVIQIVGGYDKHLPFDDLAKALAGRAKAALCIGATGPTIARLMEEGGGSARVERCGDLTAAMNRAGALAEPGDVVLLSTGCASYDQFPNFEHRGEAFAALAKQAGRAM